MTVELDYNKFNEVREEDEELSYMLDVEEVYFNIQTKKKQNARRKNK